MRNGIRFGPAIAVTFLCATVFSATIAPLHAQAVTNANSTKSTTTANNINPEHESTFEEACQCVRHRNFKDAHHKLNSLADNQHAKALTLERVLVLKQTNERIQTAQAQYGAGLGNLEKSWKGYIDIVNSVNEAAAYKPR